jgi:iron complex transport system substrate-binding protein
MSHKLALVIILISLVLAGCSPVRTPNPATSGTSTNGPISLVDGLGRRVALASPAQRVVSLAPSNTEILFAVGAGSQVVGRDSFSDYPQAASAIQDIGGSMGNYNTEAILALKPDLVLAGGINSADQVAALEKVGLTVYYLANPSTLEEMYANLETVGQLTGRSAQAAQLVASLQARVKVVDEKISQIKNRPTVYYEVDATDPTKPYTYGPGSFGDLLIQRAGGTNIGDKLQGQFAQISLEQLVNANPTVVLLGDAAGGMTPAMFAARAGLQNLQAVQDHQVYVFNDDLISRPGPRLVDGLEALAKLLHPEFFP